MPQRQLDLKDLPAVQAEVDRLHSGGYEKLGQFCDAVLPIETWVALNPEHYDTSQTRAIITTYRNKGKCDLATATGEMDRLKKDNEKQEKELAGLHEEARRANIPPGWLR